MPTTYPAILRHGVLDWLGDPPAQLFGATELRVRVTLPDDPLSTLLPGAAAVEALTQLAARGGPSGFGDPVEWQREMRIDRPMPGREP